MSKSTIFQSCRDILPVTPGLNQYLAENSVLLKGTQRRASGEYETRDTNTLPMSLKVGAKIETCKNKKKKPFFCST